MILEVYFMNNLNELKIHGDLLDLKSFFIMLILLILSKFRNSVHNPVDFYQNCSKLNAC